MKSAILFANSALGIYIPQYFAESHNPEKWCGIDTKDMAILNAGPDHEFYWETWESVLNSAETIDGAILHQDDDLWVIYADTARDLVNSHCAARLEYEESHPDAGDIYSLIPHESWCSESTKRLLDELERNGITSCGLEGEEIADLAFELFSMRPGSIWGPYQDGVILDSYALHEVEINLEPLGLDGVTLDFIRESCEPYITDTNLAYLTTDAVWYAIADPAELKAAIQERAAEKADLS